MTIRNTSIWNRAKQAQKDKGFFYIVLSGINLALQLPFYLYYKICRSSSKFELQGQTYYYFYAFKYNRTWKTERSIEIPIIREIIRLYQGKRILELGNVLSHYFPIQHDVLDKYEKTNGIINQDVVDFKPANNYDLIVSISTLEHVGWDETPRKPDKIVHAIRNLKSLLNYEGEMVVTMPLGYNFAMEELIKQGEIKFTELYYLKRTSLSRWVEVRYEDIRSVKYGHPYPSANGLLIGLFKKGTKT
jgi:hypothetical protein